MIDKHYVSQENVQVFPFGKQRRIDENARVLNEQNITNLVRMLTDKKSYVVSYDSETHIAEFVINGYYFRTDLTDLCTELVKKSIFATITLSSSGKYSYLEGGDLSATAIDGSGTVSDPYVLVMGHYETSISTDTYFKYKFEKSGTIVIKKTGSATYDSISLENYTTNEIGDVIITGNSGQDVNIEMRPTSDTTDGDVILNVVYENPVFTAVTFTSEQPQDEYQLQLLSWNSDTNKHEVPSSSYLRFDGKSVGGSLVELDLISCGTAADVMVENL